MTLVTRPTAELEGPALDWAVARVEGHSLPPFPGRSGIKQCWINVGPATHDVFAPSTDWQQGGPLIEKHNLTIERPIEMRGCAVTGFHDWRADHPKNFGGLIRYSGRGKTALIAACRAIVASKLGDTVQVPEELLTCA
ncbi:hypothetical protein NL64_06295 [Pseudomonas fluorescens]|uniref:phage protein NinX family protein n=1 Tax=Pseudomonas fluorescens TaxID=294 RepID=UPI00054B1AD7|nr:phage protein NinX family protein [Pseudomonas fluorescens]KII34868.1 hypothetical protein NL64_06295 [Pseudomonas fluorescens]